MSDALTPPSAPQQRDWQQTHLEFQAILENAWVGILFSRDRRVQHCNPRFSEIFGWPHGRLSGEPGLVLYPSQEAYDEVGRVAGPILAAGGVYEAEIAMMRRDGSTFLARLHGKAVDAANTAAGTIWIVEDITDRRQAEFTLQNLLLEQEAIFDNASAAIIFTRDGFVIRCNPRAEAIYGWPKGELIGLPGSTFFPSLDDYQRFGKIASPVLSSGQQLDIEWIHARRDGSTFQCRTLGKALQRGDGSRSTIWITEDITARKEAELAVQQLLTTQRAILDNATVGILFTRRRIILECNPRLTAMLGWEPEQLKGRDTRVFFADDANFAQFEERALPVLAAGELFDAEWQVCRQDGSRFWCRISARSITQDADEPSTVWITEDITFRKSAEDALRQAHDELEQRVRERTAELAAANDRLRSEIDERRQAEDKVRHMAHHDALTGLPNRRLLHDRLAQSIALAHRHRHQVAVMFIDLDRFKTINDTLGHAVGDELLLQVGRRITAELREGDTVARLGGDEFVVVLPELEHASDAAVVAQKLMGCFATAFRVGATDLRVSPSIGIALYPGDGGDAETLTRNADTAMYHAKDMGRNNHQFYAEQMNLATAQRFALEHKLHRALELGELSLHYQPRLAIDSRRLRGVEALLRWNAPGEGLIPPGRFIPVAEDTNLILPIGEWVLREACRQHVAWREGGHAPLQVAVNLSPRQFRDPDLVRSVESILGETGMDPRYLALEITEGSLMQSTEHTMRTLHAFNDIGVELAIDDFGVGYSSLTYLKRFPVDQLKIDQSFVRDIVTDPDDAAIVSAIIGLADNLKLSVVAEGVENAAQLDFVAACGCNEAQGFYFAPGLPAAELESRFLQRAA